MKNRCLFVFIIWTLCFELSPSLPKMKDGESSSNSDSLKVSSSKISLYCGGGALEVAAIGIQSKISIHHWLGLKLSAYILSGRGLPPAGWGVGGVWTYSVPDRRIFNVFNAEVTYMHKTYHVSYPPYAIGAEVTTGHKSYEKGFHLFWLIGASFSTAPKIFDVYSPTVKIGGNINF